MPRTTTKTTPLKKEDVIKVEVPSVETGVADTETKSSVEKVESKIEELSPRKREQTDGVRCKSITVGGLYMTGLKSNVNYEWLNEGDVAEVEYQDVVAAIRSNSSYIFKPYFIVEDEDVLKEFPKVEAVYKTMYSVGELKNIFSLSPGSMIATIKSLPAGAQESVKHMASTLVSNGELDSIKKIKALDEYFGTELVMLTGLVGI